MSECVPPSAKCSDFCLLLFCNHHLSSFLLLFFNFLLSFDLSFLFFLEVGLLSSLVLSLLFRSHSLLLLLLHPRNPFLNGQLFLVLYLFQLSFFLFSFFPLEFFLLADEVKFFLFLCFLDQLLFMLQNSNTE